MNPLRAYIGGVRSGKSQAALDALLLALPRLKGAKTAYFATLLSQGAGKDKSLALRLKKHRLARPTSWTTLEVGTQLEKAATLAQRSGHDVWLVDGLGLWVALRMRSGEGAVLAELKRFLALAAQTRLCLIVLDEVGQGGVAGHPVAREFADINGLVNQAVAQAAKQVLSVQAGLTQRLK